MDSKIYPERTDNPYRWDLCECLHASHSHELTWYLGNGKCEKCKCPKFKKIGCFTYEEWDKLCREKGVDIFGR